MAVHAGKRQYGVKLVRGPFLKLPQHPQACDDVDELLGLVGTLEGPLAADLFSGAGGLSLGLEAAGFQVVVAVDNDTSSIETHRAWFPGLALERDLADDGVIGEVSTLLKRAGVSLIAGGPPCQPFSRAGRSYMRDQVRRGSRDAYDHRRDLWQSFLDIVGEVAPSAVLMENVPDMALERDMEVLRTMVDELERLGYGVHARLVNAWRHGVPQHRQRLILVALADRRDFVWPDEMAESVTLDNAISDLPPVEGGWRPVDGAEGWVPYDEPSTSFQRRARRGVLEDHQHRIYDHITRPVREDDARVFAMMDPSTLYSDIDEDLRRYRADTFDDKYKRLDGNDLSRSITAHIAKDGYWYIHPYQDRTITVREAARIQTFPDWFRFSGPPSAAFRQIGNAVPPALAEHIGGAVLGALSNPRRSPSTSILIAEELATWFSERPPTAMPWLKSMTRWSVLQAELLLDRASADAVRSIWPLLEKFECPEDTLEHASQLREMASWIARDERAQRVLEAARWFRQRIEKLDSVSGMCEAPHIRRAAAELAARVVPGPDDDPVLSTYGVLRVAARFTGEAVDRVNRLSDGRMAIARLVSVEPIADRAHLGLIELANSLCRPSKPVCPECPLQSWCAEAGSAPPVLL